MLCIHCAVSAVCHEGCRRGATIVLEGVVREAECVEGELGDMKRSITSIDDVVEHEITRAVLEVAEAEVAERIQGTFDTLAGVNQTSAERDLYEVMRRADSDGTRTYAYCRLGALLS